MFQFAAIATLFYFTLAAPQIENVYQVPINASYVEDLQTLSSKNYQFNQISIDAVENEITAVLSVPQHLLKLVTEDLQSSKIPHVVGQLRRINSLKTLDQGIVNNLLSKSWRTIYLMVLIKNDTNDFNDLLDTFIGNSAIMFIGLRSIENYDIFTVQVEENNLHILKDYLINKGIQFEELKRLTNEVNCFPEAVDSLFLGTKITYVTADLKSEDLSKINQFVDNFENDNDIEFRKIILDEVNRISIRVRQYKWPNVEKYLVDKVLNFSVTNIGEKVCND